MATAEIKARDNRTLEERVAALEREVLDLRAELQRVVPVKDWRSTIGMFAGDEFMKRVFAAGQAWRGRERQRARRQQAKRRRAKT